MGAPKRQQPYRAGGPPIYAALAGRFPGQLVIVGFVNLPGRRALALGGAAVLVAAGATAALAVGAPSAPRSHQASLPADGRTSATLEVVTGTRLLRVTVADLGGTLLRASTPQDAPAPALETAGHGDVLLSESSGTSAVTVTLNDAVSWQLDFGGGTEQTTADLRGAKISAISFTAGSDIIDLLLPRPGAMVPVRLAGGASQFLLSVPGGVALRVAAGGGAGEVSVDGADYTGVGGGTVFATRGWSATGAGFDIEATAGAARIAVTVEPTAAPR